MELSDLAPVDPRAAMKIDRVDLLGPLTDDEWIAPTDAGHWRVKDVALHLLDDDLGWISRGRDRDMSGLLPTDGDYRDFVRSLDATGCSSSWSAVTGFNHSIRPGSSDEYRALLAELDLREFEVTRTQMADHG